MCDKIKASLHNHNIYSFNPDQHQLPYLTYVLYLAIMAVMSAFMNVLAVGTTTVIWEFDLPLLDNHILNDSLDIVAAICTLAIKVCQ